MRIGVDFDNTIAGYDHLFRNIAPTLGYDGPRDGDKRTIRDAMRAKPDGEAQWRRLQAQVYGAKMSQAVLIDGVDAFLAACRDSAINVVIVSHKTQFAAADQDGIDLRDAAMSWMAGNGFFDADRLGLSRDAVFFEDTREQKVARIGQLGCTDFIDDLEEVLRHPAFPADVDRILLAPMKQEAAPGPYRICRNWKEIADELLGSGSRAV